MGNLHAFMKSANSGAPTPTKNGSNTKMEEKYSHRLNQSHQQNSNGKGKSYKIIINNLKSSLSNILKEISQKCPLSRI